MSPRHIPAPSPVKLGDVQGIIVHGYRHMKAAAFLLLRIKDAGPCRAWLREILKGALTTAEEIPREERERRHACLNVAFTWHGLRALGLDEDALGTFPYEFRQGMPARAQVLGDTGASAPEHWDFGGTRPGAPPAQDLHLLVMLYGRTEDVLREHLSRQREAFAAGADELFCQRAAHLREERNGQIFFREPFGFRDALSQPSIQGFPVPRRPSDDYDQPLATGEFLLGYENEYQEKPFSPSSRARRDVHGLLGPAGPPERVDLGRDGSYLVLRKLRQDVEGFHDFVEKNKGLADGLLEEDGKKREWLKAKLLGRWPNGAALKPNQHEAPEPEPGGPSNAFTYAREDAAGLGCPVTSHVRRVNPRDSLAPEPALSMRVSRRHRILRRGIAYQEPRPGAARAEQGLLFLAVNAQLGRQFEFIQQSWLNNEKLGRMYDERDPVASNLESGVLTLPMKPLRQCVRDIQSFVSVKGGGYFFMPGVKALEFLSHLEIDPE